MILKINPRDNQIKNGGFRDNGTIIIKMINTSTPLNWDRVVLNERLLNFAACIRPNIVTTGSVKSL